MVDLFKLVVFLILFIHLQGCVWYASIKINAIIPEGWLEGETLTWPNSEYYQRMIQDENGNKKEYNPWYPPLDWLEYEGKWFSKETSYFEAYIMSLYHSVLVLGHGDLGPVNTIEMFVAVTILITNLFINMKVFVDLGLILDKLSSRTFLIQGEYDNRNQVMANMDLP